MNEKYKLDIMVEEKYYYYDVYLFENRIHMLDWYKSKYEEKEREMGYFDAMTTSRSIGVGDKEEFSKIGEILLHKESLEIGLLSHESNHAALAALRLFESNAELNLIKKENEEKFCNLSQEILHRLMNKICNKYVTFYDYMLSIKYKNGVNQNV